MVRVSYHKDHFQAVIDSMSSACAGPLNFTN